MSGAAKFFWLATAFFVIAAFLARNSPPMPEEPRLNVSVMVSAERVVIDSRETETFFPCDLVLNDDYRLDGRMLIGGREAVFPVAEFADGGGRRFNFFAVKPKTMAVYCRKPVSRSALVSLR